MNNIKLAARKKQSGVILVVALVILLVLTLLVVSSMNTTNTQVLMTGNTQFQTQALNDAEQALRFAEKLIDTFASNATAKPSKGYYDLTSGVGARDFSAFQWATGDTVTYVGKNRNSLYVIEYTGLIPLNGASIAVTQNNNVTGDEAYLFRITAQAKTARGASRIVQSVYITNSPPL